MSHFQTTEDSLTGIVRRTQLCTWRRRWTRRQAKYQYRLQILCLRVVGALARSAILVSGVVNSLRMVMRLSLAAMGRYLASNLLWNMMKQRSSNRVEVYDLRANMRTVKIDAHQADVNSCCWADTASGNVLISASDDTFVKVWCVVARSGLCGIAN